MSDIATVRADFDRLAAFSDDGWNHNSNYHPFLLGQLPPRIGAALEIGCGAGGFSRLLACRADHVLGLDLAPEMIRIARERSQAYPNTTYEVADVIARDLPAATYDCIASIATFHHLPLATMLQKVAQALRPGGTLLILDLYNPGSPADYFFASAGAAYNLALSPFKRKQQSPEERQAWYEHGKNDHYPTPAQVRRAARLLPGARVRRHLLWRYSLVWRKAE